MLCAWRWFVSSRGFLLWIWCIFIFLLSAVSMEMSICLVGEAQKPTECVSTVNIDHNTIYWVRHIGQLTPRGSITMETCSKHTFSHVHSNHIQNAYGPLSVLKVPSRICAFVHQTVLYNLRNYKSISENQKKSYHCCLAKMLIPLKKKNNSIM